MKRIVIVTALVMTLALGAWASGQKEASGPTSIVPPGPLGKYEPAISMSTVASVDVTTKFDPGDDMDHNVWTRAYADELGILYSHKWTVEASQYGEKLSLAIASRDLPDMFAIGAQDFVMLTENDAIAELTTAWNTYASPTTKSMTAQDPIAMKSATVGGKIMGIPRLGFAQDGASVGWIREDWYKKLGFTEPKTQEELERIAEAFVTRDPDGNGKNDTFAVAVNKGVLWFLQGFFNAYGAYPGAWLKGPSGALVNGTIQPEMKSALRVLQRWYAAGYLDKEFGVKDGGKVSEDTTAGRIGLQYGAWWNCFWPLNFSRDADPNAEWVALPPLGTGGKPGKAQYSSSTGAFVVVRKGYAYPEAVVKMLNMWHGIISNPSIEAAGKYIFNVNNPDVVYYKYVIVGGDHAWEPLGNVKRTIQINDALKTGKTDGMGFEALMTLQDMLKLNEGDRSGAVWGNWGAYGPRGSMWVMKAVSETQGMQNEFYALPTPAMVDKLPTLDKMRDEVVTNIILGAPVDETFDKFVRDWKNLGGDQMTSEVNAWYATNR